MNKLKKLAEQYNLTFERLVLRLISAYAIVNSVMLLVSETELTDKYTLSEQNYIRTACFIIGLTLVLCAFLMFARKSVMPDKVVMLVSVSLFNVFAAFRVGQSDYNWLYIMLMLFEAAACWYCFAGYEKDIKLSPVATKSGYFVAAAAFTAFLGILLALRYLTFCAPNFDFGIFAQMFHYMKKCGVPYTTCERDTLLSHFAVHMSPIYYLILPFYCIFESPVTINVAQAVILAAGFVPLYLLCRKKGLSEGVTLLFAVIYAFYPALSAGCFYDLHENVFLVPCILFLMYFIETDRTAGIFVSAALTLAIKEDAAVYVIFIAVFMMIAKKMYLKGGITLAAAAVYFIAVIYWLNNYGDGAMVTRYSNYTQGADGSLLDVIKSCVTSPVYVFSQCCSADKFLFTVKMLVPLGFLPLLCKKYGNFLLLAPFMIINLMSDYPYQHSLDFQYNFGVLAIFFYLAVDNLSELAPDRKKMFAVFCAVASVCLFFPSVWYRTDYIGTYRNSRDQFAAIEEALDENLPEDAEIAINTFLLPHVCDHDVVYQLSSQDPEFETRVKYLVFDIRYGEFITQYEKYIENGRYSSYYKDANIAILTYDNAN